MDKNTIRKIKSSLKKYEESIEATDKNIDNLEIHGRHHPSSPYLFKYGINLAIERYEKEGADLSEIRIEYERVNKKLEILEQKKDKSFRTKLFEELKYYVDDYPATISFFLELDPIDLETENDMAKRDILEILIMELSHDYDLHDMKIKVGVLDEVLRCQFKSNIDMIMKESPDIEITYYPEHFWWRHPSTILRDVEESWKGWGKM